MLVAPWTHWSFVLFPTRFLGLKVNLMKWVLQNFSWEVQTDPTEVSQDLRLALPHFQLNKPLVPTTQATTSKVRVKELPEEESEKLDNNNAQASMSFPFQDYKEFKAEVNEKLDAIFKTLQILVKKRG